MADLQFHFFNVRASADLHLAAGGAGGEHCRTSFANVRELLLLDALRHLRLEQVINSSAAAAAFRTCKRH